jgi:hypothetical protein
MLLGLQPDHACGQANGIPLGTSMFLPVGTAIETLKRANAAIALRDHELCHHHPDGVTQHCNRNTEGKQFVEFDQAQLSEIQQQYQPDLYWLDAGWVGAGVRLLLIPNPDSNSKIAIWMLYGLVLVYVV